MNEATSRNILNIAEARRKAFRDAFETRVDELAEFIINLDDESKRQFLARFSMMSGKTLMPETLDADTLATELSKYALGNMDIKTDVFALVRHIKKPLENDHPLKDYRPRAIGGLSNRLPDETGLTVNSAAERGDIEALSPLLDKLFPIGRELRPRRREMLNEAFIIAIENGHLAAVKALYEHGAQLNTMRSPVRPGRSNKQFLEAITQADCSALELSIPHPEIRNYLMEMQIEEWKSGKGKLPDFLKVTEDGLQVRELEDEIESRTPEATPHALTAIEMAWQNYLANNPSGGWARSEGR